MSQHLGSFGDDERGWYTKESATRMTRLIMVPPIHMIAYSFRYSTSNVLLVLGSAELTLLPYVHGQ
jgi:hypothetical protein